MGVVYKARHVHMNRVVALKVIDRAYLTHPTAVRRFYQEVQAAAQLHHPNIVMAFDAGQAGQTHFLAMEYVDGTDLARLLKQSGPLPLDQAREFIRQTALGLQHAHEKGMVHRDIKPSNLLAAGLRSGKPVIKILDMGLALARQTSEDAPTAADGGLTAEGHWVGTADYIAPEQSVDPHHVDIRADLYSLGCTFYHLLTGKVPFSDPAPMEKILKHNLVDPTPVEQLRPEVSPEVAAVVRRLMAKSPFDRYATPAAVAEALS
jgi:serine/threonine protein kinase